MEIRSNNENQQKLITFYLKFKKTVEKQISRSCNRNVVRRRHSKRGLGDDQSEDRNSRWSLSGRRSLIQK